MIFVHDVSFYKKKQKMKFIECFIVYQETIKQEIG